jgi:hypothetical protein
MGKGNVRQGENEFYRGMGEDGRAEGKGGKGEDEREMERKGKERTGEG